MPAAWGSGCRGFSGGDRLQCGGEGLQGAGYLDPETVAALTEPWDRCTARAATGGLPLAGNAFVFSLVPDRSVHLVPSSVSQRYGRLARRLGIDTHLHSLRH